jgi:2-polyprenyl-6-methoxyphenol hydroxylase-like FAD-dependent oxidoreductase
MAEIAIVGAGVGGLCAARAIALAGHEPIVLERSTEGTAIGAGLVLWPNAVKALDRLGVGEAVRAAASTARRTLIRAADGTTLSEVDAEALGHRVGAPMLIIERSALHRLLGQGLEIRTGANVTAVSEFQVTVDNGERVIPDAVIGADGINSIVRATIAPASKVLETGYAAIRAIAAHDIGDGETYEVWGSDELTGGAALLGGRTYWFYEAPTDAIDPAEPLTAVDPARWPDPVAAVVAATDPADVLVNRVRTVTPSRTWTRGTIALLGDAAHAMAPNLGQGAAQAIEDAAALLDAFNTEDRLSDALGAYAAARRPRAEMIQRESARMARVALNSHARGRNLVMRLLPNRGRTRAIERLLG